MSRYVYAVCCLADRTAQQVSAFLLAVKKQKSSKGSQKSDRVRAETVFGQDRKCQQKGPTQAPSRQMSDRGSFSKSLLYIIRV